MPKIDNKPAQWWMLTIPKDKWEPSLSEGIKYLKGQHEIGKDGYSHWQVVVCLASKQRLTGAKKLFPKEAHLEPTRSKAANEYVWKKETAQEGSQFELGKKPMKRNDPNDWEIIKQSAKDGNLDEIPGDIFVRCYSQLKRIEKDYVKPELIERKTVVFIGPTNVGKSHRAWDEAGIDAFPKDPNTKFWDGYRGQESVVIEEFRGRIDISHMLRWLDKWPVVVEIKGGATVLKAKKIFITSNLPVTKWYPDLDEETYAALLRRLDVRYITKRED